MTIAIAVSVLAGMAIGLRFRIYMVVPAIISAALATAIISIQHGNQLGSVGLAVLLSSVAVQIGYLCGTFALSMKETPLNNPSAVSVGSTDAYRSRTGAPV